MTITLTPVTFATQTTFNVDINPLSVSVVDVNGDGKADLVTANNGGHNISVLLGDGRGNFATQTTFAVGADEPRSVSVADFNGDGKMDLVTANYWDNNVSVLLGDGRGNFALSTIFQIGPHPKSIMGTYPLSVITVDVNGDGKVDLVTANLSDHVSVLLGDGRGSFSAPAIFPTGTSPWSVSVTDVNGDGKVDLVTADNANNNVSVLLGDGQGNFSTKTTFAVGASPVSVSVVDVNGDGKVDLVTANRDDKNVSVLLGDGRGNFATQTTFAVGDFPNSMSVADVNGDGKMDLVAAIRWSNKVSVLLGDGLGNFSSPTTFVVGPNPTPFNIADVNGDGKADLIVPNSDGMVAVLLNTTSIPLLNHVPTGTVLISGTTTQGQTLTANTTTLADADGLGALNYQWLSNGTVISGATQTSYTLTANDVGKNISIKASYIDKLNNPESVTSSATALVTAVVDPAVNHAPTGSVTISGIPQEGQTLTVSNTLADVDGKGVVSYQWYWVASSFGGMRTPIDGATQDTYTIKYMSDFGRSMYDKIVVEASYTDLKNHAESVASSATAVVVQPANVTPPTNHVPTGNVTITGTTTQGQTLTVNKGTLADADGLGAVINYQWLSGGNVVSGANQSTYALTSADVGKAISVKASYVDLQNTTESVTSSATALVISSQSTPPGNVIIPGIPTPVTPSDFVKTFVSNRVFTVADSYVNVSGANGGNETVRIQSGIDNIKFDANIERLELSHASSTYKFISVPGVGLEIWNASPNTKVVTIPSTNQDVKIAFLDGTAVLKQTGATTFQLGNSAITVGTSDLATTPNNVVMDTNDLSTVASGGAVIPTTIAISATNPIGVGTANIDTFNIAAGNYNATISGFAPGDILKFSTGASLSVTPDTNQTDGMQQLAATDNVSGVVTTTTITLTGLTAAQDAGAFNIASFNTIFGAGSIGSF